MSVLRSQSSSAQWNSHFLWADLERYQGSAKRFCGKQQESSYKTVCRLSSWWLKLSFKGEGIAFWVVLSHACVITLPHFYLFSYIFSSWWPNMRLFYSRNSSKVPAATSIFQAQGLSWKDFLGWGDGSSVCCASMTELDLLQLVLKSQLWWGMLTIPVIWRQQNADPWAFLTSQPSFLGEVQANERPFLTKGEWVGG